MPEFSVSGPTKKKPGAVAGIWVALRTSVSFAMLGVPTPVRLPPVRRRTR